MTFTKMLSESILKNTSTLGKATLQQKQKCSDFLTQCIQQCTMVITFTASKKEKD